MLFKYAAKSIAGVDDAGQLEADSLAAARRLLRERGLFPLSLAPVGPAWTPRSAAPQAPAKAKAAAAASSRGRKRKVKKQDLMLLTSQLVIMARAGIDLCESLQNCAKNCRSPALKAVLTEMHEDVSAGQSFSSAIARQSQVFGESFAANVAAGEASGKVPEVLARMADLLRSEIKLRSTILGAITYPLVLFGVCLIVTAALLLFVLPNFSKVFDDLGVAPPASTAFLLWFSGEFRARFWLWLGIGAAAIVAVRSLLWTEATTRALEGQLLRLPRIGSVLQSLIAGRLFYMLGNMLQSGVPLVQALQLCRLGVRSVAFRGLLEQMTEEVLNGRGMGKVLHASPVVPAGVAQMIETAEHSGRLGSVMESVGEYYESDGQRQLQELAKMLEPMIIITMGVIVAFVVASIMLPILDISSASNF